MKITFIGAGSFGFTRKLVRDVLTFETLEHAHLCLMDIDPERLDFAAKAVRKIVRMGGYPATVSATRDRTEALQDADFVIVTILVGGADVFRHDIEVPMRYGVDTNIGDTRGPSGIFRAIRTVPVMLDIARDMERLCPGAIMLNYTNPMAMICQALAQETDIQLTGLCHSVQGTAEMLARWIGADMADVQYTCAGINHMAWYKEYLWKGEDAYPLIHAAITGNEEIYNTEQVRNEMYLALGYYVTESSGHNSEYNWWFRKRSDLIEQYCTHGTNWNPGEYAYVLNRYAERAETWKAEAEAWFADETPIELERGHEYAAYIMDACAGGTPFQFNGNVLNYGLVDNLPDGCCVEVPVWSSPKGLEPVAVGGLPASCAMLTGLSAQIEQMAVEGILTGDPTLIYRAIAHDPLTASLLSLQETKAMVNDMFAMNRDWMPTFQHYAV